MAARSGWKPATYDGRDYVFSADGRPRRFTDARRVVFAHPFPPRNQRNIPCCVATASCVALEVWEQRTAPAVPLSALFNYFCARSGGEPDQEVEIRAALDSVSSDGICRHELHNPGFTIDGARQQPSDRAYEDARHRRLLEPDPNTEAYRYYRLLGNDVVAEWREALRSGFPLLIGLYVTESYRRMKDGLSVHPDPRDQATLDGHCVAVIGFDDQRAGGAFLAKDSRGAQFGDGGSWWLPYRLAETPLVNEAWAVEGIGHD